MVGPPDCNGTATHVKPNGDCGNAGMAILYLVTGPLHVILYLVTSSSHLVTSSRHVILYLVTGPLHVTLYLVTSSRHLILYLVTGHHVT